MLKHVVFFKLKNDVPEPAVAEIENGLRDLPKAIPEIREFIFGRDVVRSERSYDFALVSEFDDLAALERYRIHPAHLAVLQKIRQICDSILAVDFEIQGR